MTHLCFFVDQLEPAWQAQLHAWDDRQTELRAICLVLAKGLPGQVAMPEAHAIS